MHVTMVKKPDCRKCDEATEYLQSRGLWPRVSEVVWADESNPDSAGMRLAATFGIDRVPFFVVRDESGETAYTSVLQLVRDRLGQQVTPADALEGIDPDDIGGI